MLAQVGAGPLLPRSTCPSSLHSGHSGDAAAPCSVAPGNSHTLSEPVSPFVKWTHNSHLLHCPRRSSESKQGRWALPSPSPRGEPAWGLWGSQGSRTSPTITLLPPRARPTWPCPATPSPHILPKPKTSGAGEPSETTATWVNRGTRPPQGATQLHSFSPIGCSKSSPH